MPYTCSRGKDLAIFASICTDVQKITCAVSRRCNTRLPGVDSRSCWSERWLPASLPLVVKACTPRSTPLCLARHFCSQTPRIICLALARGQRPTARDPCPPEIVSVLHVPQQQCSFKAPGALSTAAGPGTSLEARPAEVPQGKQSAGAGACAASTQSLRTCAGRVCNAGGLDLGFAGMKTPGESAAALLLAAARFSVGVFQGIPRSKTIAAPE